MTRLFVVALSFPLLISCVTRSEITKSEGEQILRQSFQDSDSIRIRRGSVRNGWNEVVSYLVDKNQVQELLEHIQLKESPWVACGCGDRGSLALQFWRGGRPLGMIGLDRNGIIYWDGWHGWGQQALITPECQHWLLVWLSKREIDWPEKEHR